MSRTSSYLPTLFALTTLTACADDEGRRPGNPEDPVASQAGNFPNRWQLDEQLSLVSASMNVEIHGSPEGDHKESNCTDGLEPGALVLRSYLQEHFEGVQGIGGFACRKINGNSNKTSIHGMGRALDIMVACGGCEAPNDIGDPIAAFLIEHAEEIGVQRIIWDNAHWKAKNYLQTDNYGGNGWHPHNDHLHVEINLDAAAMLTPWFNNGGPDEDPDGPAGSCQGWCGAVGAAPGSEPSCYCDDTCEFFGDCCEDYVDYCEEPQAGSCEAACGQPEVDGCSCDETCLDDGDCCADFQALCNQATLPPQDGCESPCYPDFALGTHCTDSGLMLCGDLDDDGCSEWSPLEECADDDACYGHPGDAGCCEGAFCDDDQSPFEGDIDYLAAHELTAGCNPNDPGPPSYCPNELANREQVIVMLARATDLPIGGHPDAFTDDDGHWAEQTLDAAAHYGLTQGYGNGEFGVGDPASRTHAAAFIVNFYDLPIPGADVFGDDDMQPAWVQNVHNALSAANITSGCGGTTNGKPNFCGSDELPREHLAAFVARAHDKLAAPAW